MDERLQAIIAAQRVFLRSEAADLGYDDKAVSRMMGARIWHRVRRGAYTFKAIWDAAETVQKHRIVAAAVMRSLGDRAALSHVSALLEEEVDVFGADLSRVHVTRLDGGSGRVERDLVHHEGTIGSWEMAEIDGRLVMRPERALLQYATGVSVESGLVSVDSALHKNLADPDVLDRLHRVMERWPDARHVDLVLRLADGRAESVGESRSRYLYFVQGIPRPELQFHVYDENGTLIGITDFAWPDHRMLGEFDGKIKYGRLLRPGQEAGDAVFAEKRREDRLREVTGFGMFRLITADLYSRGRTGARVRRMLKLSA